MQKILKKYYDTKKFTEILYEDYLDEISAAKKAGQKFAYYTNAETALKLFQKESSLWMRSTQCMNDYAEISYGVKLLKLALDSQAGQALKDAIANAANVEELNAGHPVNSIDRVFMNLDIFAEDVIRRSYVACLSEHREDLENEFGRLSMWRAYGKNSGVAIICNGDQILSQNLLLGVVARKVRYSNADDVENIIHSLAERIKLNSELIKSISQKEFNFWVRGYFASLLICIKHPSFFEEAEWRLIYWEGWAGKRAIKLNIECLDGIPQKVYKIPLKKIRHRLGVQSFDLSLSKILNCVLIGPTDFPELVGEALESKLKEHSIEDLHDKIRITNIPLRQ